MYLSDILWILLNVKNVIFLRVVFNVFPSVVSQARREWTRFRHAGIRISWENVVDYKYTWTLRSILSTLRLITGRHFGGKTHGTPPCTRHASPAPRVLLFLGGDNNAWNLNHSQMPSMHCYTANLYGSLRQQLFSIRLSVYQQDWIPALGAGGRGGDSGRRVQKRLWVRKKKEKKKNSGHLHEINIQADPFHGVVWNLCSGPFTIYWVLTAGV